MEYQQREEQKQVEALAVKEKDLLTKANNLKRREQQVEKDKPLVQALEAQLLQADKGNFYAQILLHTVNAQRTAGVTVPSYNFSQGTATGKYPRYGVAVNASGRDDELFEFVRLLEQGQHKVQVTSINYASAQGAGAIQASPAQPPQQPGGAQPAAPAPPVALPPGAQATLNVSLLYTAKP